MNIRVIEKHGLKPGKNVVVLAGVHGDEVCGVKAFDLLIPLLNIECGKVTFIYANLEAIRQNKRFVEVNLNRCFFKEQAEEIKGTLEGKTAKSIIPFLERADALLDLHASFTKESVPFVICGESQIKTASIFDSSLVVCNIDPFHPGSTDHFMNVHVKPGFCFECGYLGDEKTQEIAEKALISFLRSNGNISGPLAYCPQQIIKFTGIYKNTFGAFKKARAFRDFEMLREKTIIGSDGVNPVYGMSGQIMLFVRDCDNIGEECFLIAVPRA